MGAIPSGAAQPADARAWVLAFVDCLILEGMALLKFSNVTKRLSRLGGQTALVAPSYGAGNYLVAFAAELAFVVGWMTMPPPADVPAQPKPA